MIAASGLIVLSFAACAGTSPASNQSAPNTNAETAAASPSPSPSIPATPTVTTSTTNTGSGEPIDTSKYDEEIKRLEKQAGMRPGDDAARLALAKAYISRGNALTQARQYRSALGDYRRALRYDPDNEEAQQWAATITGILKQMGREVPTEGNKPEPLPMTPDTIAGDDEPSSKQEPKRKGGKQ